jgi:hypothetical protein
MEKNNENILNKITHAILIATLILAFAISQNSYAQKKASDINVKISFSSKLQQQPVTGRVFLLVSKSGDIEPRLQKRPSPPLFGKDISQLKPDESTEFDSEVPGTPVKSLSNFQAGDYYIQAVLNVYTEFHRADGHVTWAHMDQWEGQKPNISPGNFYSDVQKIHWDPAAGLQGKLILTKVIPPIKIPADTKWVKRVKIKSELLTKFWGHPFYIGATVLLPKGYDEHPDVYYPVEYLQEHFSYNAPHGFETEDKPESESDRARRIRNYDEKGYDFYQAWNSEDFPRMISVTILHPTPYYDDSYAVNSANNGPYGDAIMTELIPYIETKFRIIKEPYARVLSGGSTGGWEALALQLYHPDFFGGSWVFYPDPIDFRRYGLINIYDDENAFFQKDGDWKTIERPMDRTNFGLPTNTFREQSYYESVLGSRGRSGEQLAIWEATYGPTDKDGYPKPLWNPITGEIDHSVSSYMKEHNYDLRYYLESNWKTLGAKLKGKLHFYCGDMDNLFLNLGVYLMEDFLVKTSEPYYDGSFEYGRPMKGHGWRPMNNFELVKLMGKYILDKSPNRNDSPNWIYK